MGSITDVAGVVVGHAQRVGDGWATGVTVVLPPPGTVGGVDVRGGGPGTHETDALAPGTLVDTVDAVVLTGGSAFGLVSAHGVQRWCEEQGRGFDVTPPTSVTPVRRVVPIVPAAAIFDLGRGGSWDARPDAELGYEAAAATAMAVSGAAPSSGSVGAGTGALLSRGGLKGGVGTASVRVGGATVGALVVVNAVGDPVEDEALGRRRADRRHVPPVSDAPLNTTLAVVATDLRLDVAAATRMAAAGHDGLARALRPVHTLMDGDTVFALSTGAVPVGETPVLDVAAVQAAAADVVQLAVRDAVLSATRVEGLDVPPWSEVAEGRWTAST